MKRAFVVSVFVLLLFSVVFVPVSAFGQPQVISLYFDRALTQQYKDCPSAPPGTVLDTVYVAISGFTTPIEGIEYQISFPPQVIYLGDVDLGNGLWIGSPDIGRSMAFFAPQDAASPVIIQEFVILWLCDGCAVTDIPITFAPHPMSGSLRAVTSDLAFEDVIGLTSIVCPGMCKDCKHDAITASSRSKPEVPLAEQCVLDCPAGDGGVILPGGLPEEHHSPDINDDSVVNLVDFSLFAVGFQFAFDPETDFYCSGNTDLIDFVLFTRHWEHTAPIPVEQSTWGSIKTLYSD